VNSARSGNITDAAGNVLGSGSGRYFNVDLRVQKTFSVGEKFKVKGYMNFFNLFNTRNLSFGDRLGHSYAVAADNFFQPATLYGPGFGPAVGIPFTLQLGARVDF